ncbi:MAG: hypothetical protein ACE5KE_06740 [Methanosarcinales archaeon]
MRDNRYIAIGKIQRGFVTVFFDYYSSGVVELVSARFSNAREKRKYKRKIKGGT